MEAQFPRPSRVRSPNLPPQQLPLPMEWPTIPSATALLPTAEVVLPQQLWAGLPLTSQAQMQRTFVRILQEVVSQEVVSDASLH